MLAGSNMYRNLGYPSTEKTKQSRDSQVQQMCNQMLQVILHDHGTKETIRHKVSHRLLAEQLYVRKKAIAKYRKNTIPFRNCGSITAFLALTKRMSSGDTLPSQVNACEYIMQTEVHTPFSVQHRNATKINAGVWFHSN